MTNNVLRNREDYPLKIQALIAAIATVFYGGDCDQAWENFFKMQEEDPIGNHTVEESVYPPMSRKQREWQQEHARKIDSERTKNDD